MDKDYFPPSAVVAFRTKYNQTQKDLADLLGVTHMAVNFWEKGERAVPKTTSRLLKLFDVFPQLMKEFGKC